MFTNDGTKFMKDSSIFQFLIDVNLSMIKISAIYRYWLYAAVKLGCLLVTNDEMRDHIFELLGSSFFLKWKERHQVCAV